MPVIPHKATPRTTRRSTLCSIVAVALSMGFTTGATAQPASTPAAPVVAFDLRGTTFDGRPFSLDTHRGKVVVVYYWSTGCAVCRDKLPELRANAAGWKHKPFELILVNVDARREEARAYHAATDVVLRPEQRFPALWRGEPGYRDSLSAAPRRLPHTLVLDTKGQVAQRFEGRIPSDAWDVIAELLP